MQTNTTLILSGTGYELSIAPKAITLRDNLLATAKEIIAVTDPASNDAARAAIKELAALRNLGEKSRKAIKEPVLAVGKDIDTKATDFITPATNEEKRLTALVGGYAAEVEKERQRMLRGIEAKRQAEAKAAAEAEAARIKAEQEAAAALAAAEKAKKDAEAKMWEDSEENAKAAAEAAAKAAEAVRAAEAEKARLDGEAVAAAATPAIVEFIPQAAAGTKFVPDFEVTNIDALYAYSAALVTMEPKRSEILSLIKDLTNGDVLPEISGLRIFLKPVVSTR